VYASGIHINVLARDNTRLKCSLLASIILDPRNSLGM